MRGRLLCMEGRIILMRNKAEYNRGSDIIEIVIRDSSGAKMDILRANVDDEEVVLALFKSIIKKYGYKKGIEDNFWEADKELKW